MALQTILTVGKTYRVKGAYRSVGGVAKPVVISGEIRAIGTVSTSWQLFDFVFIATITTLRFDGHVPGVVQFDDVEVLDISSPKTLDSSGNDKNAMLGDGLGAGEPTQTTKGYMTFDGANDYLSGIANPAGAYTVLGVHDLLAGGGWEFFSNNDLTRWTPLFTSGSFTGNLSALMLAPSVLTQTQLDDAEIALMKVAGSQL